MVENKQKLAEQYSLRSRRSKDSRFYRSFHSSQCPSEYFRVKGSNVSNPDNLICDNCVNKNMYDNNLKDLQKQKDLDKEFANQINENLRKQLEDERRRNLGKLKIYQDAIQNQRDDQEKRRDMEKDLEAQENEKIRQMLNNKDDLLEREMEEQAKKNAFIKDLKN